MSGEDLTSCRIALISWPLDKSVENGYINLGEIYDKSMKTHDKLFEIQRDILCLYPFRCEITDGDIRCYNIEDFTHFQDKYRLTRKLQLSGDIPNGRVAFRTPVLYDLTCMVPVFTERRLIQTIKRRNKPEPSVFVVLPYANPMTRAKILNNCIELCGPRDIIVLLGGRQGNNKENTATLAYRYVRRYVDIMNIVKNPEGQIPGSIIEGIIIAQTVIGTEECPIFLASTGKDVYHNCQFIKTCKRGGFENIPLSRVQFLAPFGAEN